MKLSSFNLAILAVTIFQLIPLSCSFTTGKPVAYLGLGDLGAVPVVDAQRNIVVNEKGVMDVEVDGPIAWSRPYRLFSQAQKRSLQPLESRATSPEYSLTWLTKGTCSSEIIVKDADTGEIIVPLRSTAVGFWGIEQSQNIVFGFQTSKTLLTWFGCGEVEWELSTRIVHYDFGDKISVESKRKHATHRPPLIALRAGFYK